ncbi:MAG: Spy/CpxP family protein refolding chaperone [Firmicutes bacterium]|nr:Spy/CpxP family protein refolding chaperone [Bacillota bacterium]
MFSMKRLMGITLVAALFLGTMGIASAAPIPKLRPVPRSAPFLSSGPTVNTLLGFNGTLERFARYLGLSAEQQQKLLQLQQDFIAKTQDLRFALQQKMLELRQLWSQDKLDEAAISQKSGEVAGLRARLLEERKAQLDKVKQILTPEQQKKLDKLNSGTQEIRRGFRKGVFGRWGGAHGGFRPGTRHWTRVCPWM